MSCRNTWTNYWKTTKLSGNILKTRTSLRQNFNAAACFILELFRRLRNPKKLWMCPFKKREQRIQKTPNFLEIFMNTRTSLTQNCNAVACFVLELFRHLRNPKKLWRCSFIKRERTIEKLLNFQKILLYIWTILRQNFSVVVCFVLEFYRRLRNPKKLWRCPFIKRERTIEKTSNCWEIFMNTRTSLRQNSNAVACFIFQLFRFLWDPYKLWIYPFIKCKETIQKTPNLLEIFLNTRTSLRQNFIAVACFVL